jgi:hypothetical protein
MKRRARVNSAASPSRHGKYSVLRWCGSVLGAGPAALLAIGALAAACSTATISSGSASPARSTTKSPARPPRPKPAERLPVGTIGGYRVAEHVLRLVDRSRVRLGPRALPTTVWYPVIPPAAAASGRLARGLFPLVVFGPGFAQCSYNYGSLLHAWASAGYVVAGIDFPRSNCHYYLN